jgi:hypothetical protein
VDGEAWEYVGLYWMVLCGKFVDLVLEDVEVDLEAEFGREK